MIRHVVAISVAAVLLLAGSSASAQRPHGTPPGLLKKPGAPGGKGGSGGGSSTSAGGGSGSTPIRAGGVLQMVDGGSGAPSTVSRIRSLGVWLDDATVMGPGETWLTMSLQQWGSLIGTGIDAPVFDLVGGVVPRVHAFASVPYSRTSYTGLPSDGELGTVYLGGKAVLREPADGVVGIAVSPTLELLSQSATADTGFSRVNVVLPVSAEWRRGTTRVYGSTGYFTRGAVFLGGAVERALTDRTIVTGALSQAWATDELALAEEVGLRTSRTDLSGSVAWIASPQLMLFASAARTLSALDADATRYAFSVGASMNLYRPGRRLPVKRP